MNLQNYTTFKGNPSELPDISIKFDPPPKWVPCNDPWFFLESATGPTLGCKHRTEHLKLQVAGREHGQMVPVDGRPFFVVQ